MEAGRVLDNGDLEVQKLRRYKEKQIEANVRKLDRTWVDPVIKVCCYEIHSNQL